MKYCRCISLDSLPAHIAQQTIEFGECLEWQGPMGFCSNRASPILNVTTDGKPHRLMVRREVWKAVFGPINGGHVVYRTCSTHRCIGCLASGPRGEHLRHRARIGLAAHTPATRAAITAGSRRRAKYSAELAREVRKLVAEGLGKGEISHRTGVGLAVVSDIRLGRSWDETSYASSVFSWRPA